MSASDPANSPHPAVPHRGAPTPPVPKALHLDRKSHLEITWSDTDIRRYPLATLRANCPCAGCKKFREEQEQQKTARRMSLTILPTDHTGPISVTSAEMVGNYALQIQWSDAHASGIYSFEYLRTLP
jgi:DUF971 family protein